MIPWMREKFAERRNRWQMTRKRDSVGSPSKKGQIDQQQQTSFTCELPAPSPSKTSTSRNIQIEDEELAKLINLRVISPRGGIQNCQVPINSCGNDLLMYALNKFAEDQHSLPHFSSNVADLFTKYKLLRSKTRLVFGEKENLEQSKVLENEEFVLVVKRTDFIEEEENIRGPTASEVLLATKHITPTRTGQSTINISNLMLQGDLQLDLQRILISLARSSAYMIGSGPYAEKLIQYFKQKVINKKRFQVNSVDQLIDMGFSEEKIEEALETTSNSFYKALDWLVVNDTSTNLLFSCDPLLVSSNENETKDECFQKKKEKIDALLEIIRFYAEKDVTPSMDLLNSLVEMGFCETSVREALKRTRNNQAAACEWLLGNRSYSLTELRDGLPNDSPILQVLLLSPQVQISLGNPKMFIALISMLENYSSMSMWMSDNDTSSVLGHILRTYHEEKHIVAINNLNGQLENA